jgi:hypothetical protein
MLIEKRAGPVLTAHDCNRSRSALIELATRKKHRTERVISVRDSAKTSMDMARHGMRELANLSPRRRFWALTVANSY